MLVDRYFGVESRSYFIFMCMLYFIFVWNKKQEYQGVFYVGYWYCVVGG